MPSRPPNKPKTPSGADRRSPRQDRSTQTVDTLFEATAQILEREGEAALTTNRVAQVAGFSVGTLYQYFPSKHALVQAMGRRLREQVVQQIDRYLVGMENRPDLATTEPRLLLQQALQMMVRSMTLQGKNTTLLRLFWLLESPDQTAGALQLVAERLALFFERTRQTLRVRQPSASELFVLTRGVLGVVRSACLEKSPILQGDTLENALARMAWALLDPDTVK